MIRSFSTNALHKLFLQIFGQKGTPECHVGCPSTGVQVFLFMGNGPLVTCRICVVAVVLPSLLFKQLTQ